MSEFCSFNNPQVSLITKKFGKICKYHKRAGQKYSANDIIKDFCFDAFYTAYPYCLAFLYNAKFPHKNNITLSCPQQKGVVFTLERLRRWNPLVVLLLKLLKKASKQFSYPLDIEDHQVKLTVIENNGSCPKAYQPGKSYEFNIRQLDQLCPASFYQLYPFIVSGLKNIKLHCPDHEGMVYLINHQNTVK